MQMAGMSSNLKSITRFARVNLSATPIVAASGGNAKNPVCQFHHPAAAQWAGAVVENGQRGRGIACLIHRACTALVPGSSTKCPML